MKKHLLIILALPFSALILSSCGGSSSSNNGGGGSSGDSNYIHGTAATGAPYTGSDTLHVICKGNNGIPMIVEANNDGSFGLSKEEFDSNSSQLPCAILLQSGKLATYTHQSGRVNLTPFTTLAYTRAVMDYSGQLAADLDLEITDVTAFEAQLSTATNDLISALKKASGKSSVPFDIFHDVFEADHNSIYDRWLDGFGDAVIADSVLPTPNFLDAFDVFVLEYATQTDPADLDETANGPSFSFSIPLPTDLAIHFKNILGNGSYTLKIGITRAGSLPSINETVEGVALPASLADMCNKLQAESIQIITNGQNLSGTASCAWADNPMPGWDEEAIVHYTWHGSATYRWKQ